MLNRGVRYKHTNGSHRYFSDEEILEFGEERIKANGYTKDPKKDGKTKRDTKGAVPEQEKPGKDGAGASDQEPPVHEKKPTDSGTGGGNRQPSEKPKRGSKKGGSKNS